MRGKAKLAPVRLVIEIYDHASHTFFCFWMRGLSEIFAFGKSQWTTCPKLRQPRLYTPTFEMAVR